jgi:hypothetical protein
MNQRGVYAPIGMALTSMGPNSCSAGEGFV